MRAALASAIVVIGLAAPLPASDDLVAVIDWTAWDRMLRDHVVDGRVDYDALADERDLPLLVDAIATADLVAKPRGELIAFLVNAYNVLAVQGILDGRSPKSAFGKLRFFYLDRYPVAGETLSLHALEHRRLLPLGEPLVHFAIVCASTSCPKLRSEAYRPARLDRQLEEAARSFINDPTRNRFDLDAGRAELSKIFKWFRGDFADAAGSVQRYLAPFVDDPATAAALHAEALEVRYLPYDWSLNGSYNGR